MGYSTLKTALDAVVKTNGRQEITGANLNGVLTDILKGVDLLERKSGVDTTGMGYLALSKDKTFAEQVTDNNTIYEIRDNFSLSANMTIPSGCILYFNGGKIIGGGNTLTFSRNIISGNARFENCEFSGTILNGEVKISWFTDGMTTTSDYSVDHSSIFISAMKLTSLISNGWLNLERIPICIKQTIVITEAFGCIGMIHGNFYFVSSSDKQALFDYQQSAQYSGSTPIVDCVFRDVGDNYDTCVIKKTNWSDTAFTYWRDIRVIGFTGYFMVNCSYLQEVTFENISVSGCGFFSNNSDSMYSGNHGSGNIINFLNCNCNNGVNNSKTTLKAIYDLSDCIEVTIHNAVSQGRIGGTDIYPIYVTHAATGSTNRINILLDGFWVEYVSGNVKKQIKVENCSARFEAKRNSPIGLEVINSNLSVLMKQAGGVGGSDLLDNLSIDNVSNVTIFIDAALYPTFVSFGKFTKFKDLVDRGIIRVAKNATAPYGTGVTQTSPSISIYPKNEIDAINEYASAKITALKFPSRPFNHYFSEENGVTILNIEQVGTGTYYEMGFLDHLERLLGGDTSTPVARSIYSEIIYRVTTLVDVDASNIADVYCKSRGFINVGGGAYVDMFTITEGMTAGTSSGWLTAGGTAMWEVSGLSSGAYLSMKNCKLEIAKFRFARRNVDMSTDVYVNSSGVISRTDKKPKVFSLPIAAASDIPSTMANIITNCTAIFETPKNLYKYANGAVHGILTPTGGSTANRPVLATSDRGFVYFDSTLNKAIIWNGSAWVNMDGTALA